MDAKVSLFFKEQKKHLLKNGSILCFGCKKALTDVKLEL